MSTRDYEGWRRYGQWKKEQYENYQKQMSDGRTEALRGTYFGNKPTTQPKVVNKTVTVKNIDQMPDQKWHRRISFVKSGVRILGYALIPFDLVWATGVLIFSEVIGILEELV